MPSDITLLISGVLVLIMSWLSTYNVGNVGAINVDNQSCWIMYNYKVDPNQEKTAEGLAKFATERDAETCLKIWELFKPDSGLVLAQLQDMFNPPPPFGQPSPVEKWFANYLSQPDCVIKARQAGLMR